MLFQKIDSKARPLNVALYSHDTMGLGHTRRNLLIAQALTEAFENANVLMLTGASTSSRFSAPPRVDFLTLPSLHKTEGGTYQARELDLELKQLVKLRSRAIWAALRSFKPDVLIVDNVPKGAVGELMRSLKKLKKKGRTRLVLGLRDVLDDPKTTRKQWREAGNEAVIEKYYDEVWVYGDPNAFDPVREYRFGEGVAEKVRYLGYFDPRARLALKAPAPAEADEGLPEGVDPAAGEMVLCQVGGGQDGAHLAQTFARTDLPEGMYGVLITGPYMPLEVKEELSARAAEKGRLKVLEFVREPTRLLQHAARVVSMGGYNTTFEVLAHEKPLLMVPRVVPRLEQLVRAERLCELGLVDCLRPDELTPEALRDWLLGDPLVPAGVHERLDFGAMKRLPERLWALLDDTFVVPPLSYEVQHVAA